MGWAMQGQNARLSTLCLHALQAEPRAQTAQIRRLIQQQRAAIGLQQVRRDRQAKTGAGLGNVKPLATAHRQRDLVRRDAGPVILDRDGDATRLRYGCQPDRGAGPLQRRVEQVTQHFFQIGGVHSQPLTGGIVRGQGQVALCGHIAKGADHPPQ